MASHGRRRGNAPAAAAGPAAAPDVAPRGGRTAYASPGIVVGLIAAVVAVGLAGLSLLGTAALGAGVFAVQIVLALAWLAALDVRGGIGGFGIAVLTAAAADTAVATARTPDIGRAAPVIGLAVAASLGYQLWRVPPRPGVTASLGGMLSVVTFAVCGSAFLALRVEGAGDQAVVAALLGAGVALVVGRVVDLFARHPSAAPGSRRGIVGVIVGLVAAVVVGWFYGHASGEIDGGIGVRLAVVAAVLALVADLVVDAVLVAAPPAAERARSALPPLGVLLPVVLAGPASYIAGRILLG